MALTAPSPRPSYSRTSGLHAETSDFARPQAADPARSAEVPSPSRPLDRIDRRIVIELMRDATIPLARLADRVGLSQTPCWKRVQKLEQAGVLTGRVALADPGKLGLALTAFVAVTAPEHRPDWREAFAAAVERFPEVVEVWRVAGEADYLLKVVTADMAAFDAFYRHLTAAVDLARVTTQFALERVAFTTALPVSPDPL